MTPLVEQLVHDHGRAVHAALLAERDGFTGYAAALRAEADRLAAQARKAAGR